MIYPVKRLTTDEIENLYTPAQLAALMQPAKRLPTRNLTTQQQNTYIAHAEFARGTHPAASLLPMTTQTRERLNADRENGIQPEGYQPHVWDTSFCFHADERRRQYYGHDSPEWLEKELRDFWNRMDHAAYGKARYRHNIRIYRLMYVEKSSSVGWHCHGVAVLSGTHIDRQYVTDAWTKFQLKGFEENSFTKHLAKVDPYWEDHNTNMNPINYQIKGTIRKYDTSILAVAATHL